MKFFLALILIAITGFLLQLFLPWWSLVIAAFIVGAAILQPAFSSFICGFFGSAIVWWIYAFMIDLKNDSLLSEKIAMLFYVGNPYLLIIVCGLVAGIAGSFAALTGNAFRQLFTPRYA